MVPTSVCTALALLACTVGHAARVIVGDAEFGSLETGALVKCGDVDPTPWTEVGATPPRADTAVGNYVLTKCIAGGAYGEAWTARASSGGADVVIKIGRSAAADLHFECLFAQAIFARDPSHFTDCFDAGEWTSESGTKHSFAAFSLAPGKPWTKFLGRDSPPLPSFVDVLSFWLEFGEAVRAMHTASEADPFLLLDSDVIADNVMVSSGTPTVVTIIDYGLTMVCCTAGDPESCTKSLRLSTGVTRTAHFPPCTDEGVAKAVRRKAGAAMIEYGKVSAEAAMSPSLLAQGLFKGLDTYTKVMWPEYKAQLDDAGAEAARLFQEVLSAFFVFTERPPSTGPSSELLDKIRALRNEFQE